MNEPRQAMDAGFFIPGLGPSVLGLGWYEGMMMGPVPSGSEMALRWLHLRMLDAEFVEQVRTAFFAEQPMHHVYMDDPIDPPCAQHLRADLARAVYVRHHYPHYRIDIARRDQQRPSELTDFMDWLGSRDGAAFHHWLVGRALPEALQIQVQTSRAQVGDEFPLHQDTDKEGLAVVYNLSTDWQAQYGGILSFYRPESGAAYLAIPPRFNSVVIFEPKWAPHAVSPILKAAGERCRHTITVFYLRASAAVAMPSMAATMASGASS